MARRVVDNTQQLLRRQCNHRMRLAVVIRELDLVYARRPTLDNGANLAAHQSLSRQVYKRASDSYRLCWADQIEIDGVALSIRAWGASFSSRIAGSGAQRFLEHVRVGLTQPIVGMPSFPGPPNIPSTLQSFAFGRILSQRVRCPRGD